MSRRSLLVLVPGSVAAILVAALALPASAAPAGSGPVITKPTVRSVARPGEPVPRGFFSWAQVYSMQHRLAAAATRILAADGTGNASIVAAPQNRELRVYWHGPVPASIRALARRVGVPVAFRPAAFSFRTLVTAAKRLAAEPAVATAAPKPDGSGVAVTVTSTARAAQRNLRAVSGVPLTIRHGQRLRSLFSRQGDTPPFWGGSRYYSPAGGCSNGFGLSVSGSSNVWEISAGHCGGTAANVDGTNVTIPGQANPAGTMYAKSVCRDTLAIYYPSGVAGNVYTGAFDSSTSVPVIGDQPDYVGMLVNTDGASSGEHDNLSVENVDEFASINGIPGCNPVGPLTQAGYSDNTCAAAPGDSGGPVFSYLVGDAEAQGTITGGTSGVSCPGVSPTGGNTVVYAPMLRPSGDSQIGSLQFYGVGILTGG